MDGWRKVTRRQVGCQLARLGAGAAALSALPGWAQAAPAKPQEASAQAVAERVFTGAGSLKAHAHGLFVGTAVNTGLLASDAAYRQTLVDQYNIVVAENAMKWAALRPSADSFDFAEADRLVAFAEANAMAIRGHNLCWHEALPGWFAETVTKANAQQVLTTHIATVAGRYKGKIRSWDVVNEAIDPKDAQPNGLRNGPWYKLLGPGFIDTAFRAARAADPSALLTYNDYGIETDSPEDTAKRDAVLGLLERMKRDGVPLDAVGIQSHLSAASATKIGAGLQAFVAKAAQMGLKVFITELDVNDDGLATDEVKARSLQVAAVYAYYVGLLLKSAAVTDVLTWGVSNQSSWLNAKNPGAVKFRPKHPEREQECLPFDLVDGQYRPNFNFYALRNALDARV